MNTEATAPNICNTAMAKNAVFSPLKNDSSSPEPGPASSTSSILTSKPLLTITAVTIDAAIAVPVTLPELRDRFTNAATTPCRAESAALKIDAELGDWKRPDPTLWSKIPARTMIIEDEVVRDARTSSPPAERSKPITLNGLHP